MSHEDDELGLVIRIKRARSTDGVESSPKRIRTTDTAIEQTGIWDLPRDVLYLILQHACSQPAELRHRIGSDICSVNDVVLRRVAMASKHLDISNDAHFWKLVNCTDKLDLANDYTLNGYAQAVMQKYDTAQSVIPTDSEEWCRRGVASVALMMSIHHLKYRAKYVLAIVSTISDRIHVLVRIFVQTLLMCDIAATFDAFHQLLDSKEIMDHFSSIPRACYRISSVFWDIIPLTTHPCEKCLYWAARLSKRQPGTLQHNLMMRMRKNDSLEFAKRARLLVAVNNGTDDRAKRVL